MMALSSCSISKNTAASRRYAEFITRYNIHYNGETHYRETLEEMERKYQDDYTRLLFSHPAKARSEEKAPQPTGDFNRSIEKAQKAIQLRSIKAKPARKPGRSSDPAYKAWMKRDEYNPFLHNSWMLMARSQFMNGDFAGAAATFFYISKHFTWLPATVVEAQLWQARCYTAIGWNFEAESILSRIKPDQLTSRELKSLYNVTMADVLVASRSYSAAIPYLEEGVKEASGAQKTRLTFLLGQVAALAGDRDRAYRAYGRAASAGSADYRTRFNARIKQSEVFSGSDIEPEVKALRRMVRYDRNKEYLDQVYYAIGNLYLSRKDTTRAIENYRLAASKSTRNGIEKAVSQATLGGLYYERRRYDLAQPCYAEAIPQLPESYPGYQTLRRRSDILDQLAVYSQNVHLQDSLITLSLMTPEEQRAVIDRIIADLVRQEKEAADEARRQEFLANNPAQTPTNMGNAGNAPTTFTMNSDGSWYFYNPSTVSAGKTEFQRRWGNRRLEDNWRRRNKNTFALDDQPSPTDAAEASDTPGDSVSTEATQPAKSEETLRRESDPHYPEYYLKQIPADSAARSVSHDVIQEGLFNMGVILKDKMEDFPAAHDNFNRLNSLYPGNPYRLEALFNQYLMAERQGDAPLVARYRDMILSEFPDTKQGIALRDPRYIDNLRLMERRQEELYQQAFDAYMNNANDTVRDICRQVAEQFPMSPLMPRFMFLDALSYVPQQDTEKFRTILTDLLSRYPDTDLTPYASAWVKGLNQGRALQTDGGGGNLRGLLWDIKLGSDSTAVNDSIDFDLDPQVPQLLVLLYPTDQISPNQLLYDIARHNFTTFAIRDFDLEQMNFGQLGLLIIKGFENVDEINRYRAKMQENASLSIPAGVIPVTISVDNFAKMIKHGATFEQYFRYTRDKTYRDTQESVLDPAIFGPSDPLQEEEIAPEE